MKNVVKIVFVFFLRLSGYIFDLTFAYTFAPSRDFRPDFRPSTDFRRHFRRQTDFRTPFLPTFAELSPFAFRRQRPTAKVRTLVSGITASLVSAYVRSQLHIQQSEFNLMFDFSEKSQA